MPEDYHSQLDAYGNAGNRITSGDRISFIVEFFQSLEIDCGKKLPEGQGSVDSSAAAAAV